MEVLSPKSANLPVKPRAAMKKVSASRPKPEEKSTNPDRIEDRWRPPNTVTEPGDAPELYNVGKKLGKGGFAVCFEGRTQNKMELFALKVVKANVQQKKMMEKFRTEMQIHAKMQHPNIVEFYRAFTLEEHTYVVLEMCNNGSLTDMVKARSCLSLPEVRRFMIQICGGVKYMHKRSVIHRDLKMGNIFIDAKMNLKIGDFGLAAVMADEQDRRTTLCGTPNYIAPEILSKSGDRGHDFKVDTWAIGVIAYAMLMGTPPFQSKTQQEIYSKLKTLEYEWKIDSINYIPQEAKDAVASCLNLTAADRPDMDELVEHEFFKMGVIADALDTTCLKMRPNWLENADPRGDRTRPGYGVDHGIICNQCGVGKTLDGRYRPAVGGKANLSALMEIEVENRAGTAPVTPLPEGVLYKQFQEAYADFASTQKHPLSAKPRSRKPLLESSNPPSVTQLAGGKLDTEATKAMTGLSQRTTVIPRSAPSFAAQQRQQAVPKTQSTRILPASKELATTVISELNEDGIVESQGLLKARPVRSATAKSSKAQRDAMLTKSATVVGKLDDLSERLLRETDDTATGLGAAPVANLPTRSRSLKARCGNIKSALPTSAEQTRSLNTVSAETNKTTRARPCSQKATTPAYEVENKSLPESHDYELPKHRASFKPRLIGVTEQYTLVPSSSHGKVMRSLRNLHSSLGGRQPESRALLRSRSSAQTSHARVDKWVDYATKHGIAYILNDSSLGMILKSKDVESSSGGCIVVRNARRHTILRAQGNEHQLVPQGANAADIEFYEQTDAAFAMKRLEVTPKTFELDLRGHNSQSSACQAVLNTLSGSNVPRMREIGLLDKFGKYMNKQMGASDLAEAENDTTQARSQFIHFYQRMGNVGIWRFADGALQCNFPDHTKLIVYTSETNPEEVLIDAIYLDPVDAKELATHAILTSDALERRGLRTFTLADVQDGSLRRSEMDIVRTNEIREKLSWIRAVIGLWIKEGGLGWTGEERLGWSGMQERREDKRIKLQWVTVGRPGGDEDVLAVSTSAAVK